MTYTLLLLLPALASACNEGCSSEPQDCDALYSMLGAGGCAEGCKKSDIKQAYDGGHEMVMQCYTEDGNKVCHNCHHMTAPPENCDALDALRAKGGCAQKCSSSELKALVEGSDLEECELSDPESLAILPGLAAFLFLLD